MVVDGRRHIAAVKRNGLQRICPAIFLDLMVQALDINHRVIDVASRDMAVRNNIEFMVEGGRGNESPPVSRPAPNARSVGPSS